MTKNEWMKNKKDPVRINKNFYLYIFLNYERMQFQLENDSILFQDVS